ncbi:hypothetical protein J437_LFUL004945 [Ladona fulva]|uniref:BTB domain-containing protein n=1 Tax=Ladona fulva TaxID=123851 RepID=A0A8K0KPN2_LADFU|nr:hypothetical protein J437_LFUL004945 [Ladona fulva]
MDGEDWQLSKSGVSERIQHLHKTKQWTDCSFQVTGGNHAQAHKVILACCSPVFEAMLFGPIAEKNVIVVPDVEPEAFRILLEYIYTDCTSFTSLDAACATLYAAKKYLLLHLRQRCVMHLVALLRPSNACSLYEFAVALGEEELAQESLKVICTYLPEVLQDPSFVHISRGTLEAILQEDLVNADSGEATLISASLSWARQECKRHGTNPELGRELRQALGPEIVSYLRFMALSSEELEKQVQPRGILTRDEVDALLKARCELKKSGKEELEDCSGSTISQIPPNLCTNSRPRSSIPISLRCCPRRYLKAGPVVGYPETPGREGGHPGPPPSPLLLLCRLRVVSHCVVLTGIQVWTGLAPLSAFSLPANMSQRRWMPDDGQSSPESHHPRSPLTYEEDMEVAVLDQEGRVLCKVPFCDRVEYNSLATISLGEPVRLAKGHEYSIRLTLCQPLQYQTAFLSVSESVNGVCFEFADYADPRGNVGDENSRLVSRLDMGFVQTLFFYPRGRYFAF